MTSKETRASGVVTIRYKESVHNPRGSDASISTYVARQDMKTIGIDVPSTVKFVVTPSKPDVVETLGFTWDEEVSCWVKRSTYVGNYSALHRRMNVYCHYQGKRPKRSGRFSSNATCKRFSPQGAAKKLNLFFLSASIVVSPEE